MFDKYLMTLAGCLSGLGVVAVALLSVLNETGQTVDPGRDTSERVITYVQAGSVDFSDVRGCPIILGTSGQDDVCAYNPDGTINAFRGKGGWVTVE